MPQQLKSRTTLAGYLVIAVAIAAAMIEVWHGRTVDMDALVSRVLIGAGLVAAEDHH